MTPGIKPQRLTLTVNGKAFDIEIEDLDCSPLEIKVNGKIYHVAVETLLEAPAAPAHAPAPAAPQAPVRPPARAAAAPAISAQEIRAPMPGNILDIAVAVGDSVSVGQSLCALEAMKMKSAIRSPREGVIETVHVVEGQVVTHGELLFTFE
jgi:biotin carboxyl carrier protein